MPTGRRGNGGQLMGPPGLPQGQGKWDHVATKIIEAYRRGDPLATITATYGVPQGSINELLASWGVAPDRKWRRVDARQAREVAG